MDYKETNSASFDGNKADKYLSDEYGQTGKLHFKSPKEIEFQRYKQDCRKRALEMAHLDYQQGKILMDSKVQEAANKYYNWLISIPES